MSGTIFSMRRATGTRYHGSHSRTKLEIKGHFSMSGPQPVSDDGGVPELVHQLFEQYPKLQQVALGADEFGVVYQRMRDEPADDSGVTVTHGETFLRQPPMIGKKSKQSYQFSATTLEALAGRSSANRKELMTKQANFSGTVVGPAHGGGQARLSKIDLAGIATLLAQPSAGQTTPVTASLTPGESLDLACGSGGGSFSGSVGVDTTGDAQGGAVVSQVAAGVEVFVAGCGANSTASGTFSLSSITANPGTRLGFHESQA